MSAPRYPQLVANQAPGAELPTIENRIAAVKARGETVRNRARTTAALIAAAGSAILSGFAFNAALIRIDAALQSIAVVAVAAVLIAAALLVGASTLTAPRPAVIQDRLKKPKYRPEYLKLHKSPNSDQPDDTGIQEIASAVLVKRMQFTTRIALGFGGAATLAILTCLLLYGILAGQAVKVSVLTPEGARLFNSCPTNTRSHITGYITRAQLSSDSTLLSASLAPCSPGNLIEIQIPRNSAVITIE